MQGDGGQVEPQQAHVLHDEGVGARAVELVDEALHGGELVVVEDGVERHVDARPERVGVVGQAGDVADRVACCRAGAEARSADVDGVGAVADGFDAGVGVAGGGEEFDGPCGHWGVGLWRWAGGQSSSRMWRARVFCRLRMSVSRLNSWVKGSLRPASQSLSSQSSSSVPAVSMEKNAIER